MTTPVRQLTERLVQYSERQQVLLRALREFIAERVAERAQSPSSGVNATTNGDLQSVSVLDVDSATNVASAPEPRTPTHDLVRLEPVILEPVILEPVILEPVIPAPAATYEVDLVGGSSRLACDEELPLSRPYALPSDAPASLAAVTCDVTMAPIGEEPGVVPLSVARDETPVSAVAQAKPASKRKVRSASAPPRERRDYNYFADLEAKLSELSKE